MNLRSPSRTVLALLVASLSAPAAVGCTQPDASGRYEVDAGTAGTIRVDVSPTGVVHATRLETGASMRLGVTKVRDGEAFTGTFPDRLRVQLLWRTLTILRGDGATLFGRELGPEDRSG